MTNHPAQLRADLQRYYGLNIERMGEEFSVWHAAECASCLPLGSSLLAKIDPKLGWTNKEYMLHGIMCALAGSQIPFPWDKETGIDGLDTESVPLDQFRDWYENTEWKEVEEWREIR